GRGLDGDAVGRLDQPGPAAAEAGGGGGGELLLERLEVAEALLDRLGRRAGRLAAALGRQAVPVEGVVPDLGGVVEDRHLVGLLPGLLDDVLQAQVGQRLAGDELVELVDVRRLVLAVVILDRLLRDDRRQGVLRPRKLGKSVCHLTPSWTRSVAVSLRWAVRMVPARDPVNRPGRWSTPRSAGGGAPSCAAPAAPSRSRGRSRCRGRPARTDPAATGPARAGPAG